MSSPDALSHWPVIDELREKPYGTKQERKRRKKTVRLVVLSVSIYHRAKHRNIGLTVGTQVAWLV